MAIITTEQAKQRRQPRLTRRDILENNPLWSSLFVEDYEQKGQSLTELESDVASNTDRISQNEINIAQNSEDIVQNALGIAQNATDIAANTGLINGHINNISGAHAASAISYDNSTSGLTANNAQSAIDEIDGDLDTHKSNQSAHGVTGDNVGSEDYAQALIGGVVLLASLVNDASQTSSAIATADIGAAPATYNQAYAQQQTDLINECKSKINALVTDAGDVITQLNDLIAKMKTAKQMSTT